MNGKYPKHPSTDQKLPRILPCEFRSSTKSPMKYSIMEGLPAGLRHKDKSPMSCEEISLQVIITNTLLNKLPSLVSYIPRRLPCESPKLLSRSHSAMSLSSPPLDSSLYTPSWVGTPRPFVHISYGNQICRHRPHTSQAKLEYKIVHIFSKN